MSYKIIASKKGCPLMAVTNGFGKPIVKQSEADANELAEHYTKQAVLAKTGVTYTAVKTA